MVTQAEQMRKTINLLETQQLDEIGKVGAAVAGILAMAASFGVNIPSSYAQTPPQPGVTSQTVKVLDAAIFRTIRDKLTPKSEYVGVLAKIESRFAKLDDEGQNYALERLKKFRIGNLTLPTDQRGVERYVLDFDNAVIHATFDHQGRQDAAKLDASIFKKLRDKLTPGSEYFGVLAKIESRYAKLDDEGKNYALERLKKQRNGNITLPTDQSGLVQYVRDFDWAMNLAIIAKLTS